jgi:caffeoyl-CoA O-methyltransferase
MSQLIDPALEDYCTRLASPLPEYFLELERETHLTTLYPQMLTGAWQGQFLVLLTRLLGARRILEVGTFTGYSALCFGLGAGPGARIDTIELNEEKEHLIRKYIARAGMEDRIHLHIGHALEVLAHLEGPWDMAFLDAHKPDYIRYYELIFDKLSPGGIILADNVLWSGKVISPTPDEETAGLMAFNQMVADDSRVEQVILPIRDGVHLIRKKT